MADAAGTDQRPTAADGPVECSTMERLNRALDEWRARIDELLVQLDLAGKDVHDEVRTRAEAAENVYLAARSKLADAGHDAGGDARSAVTAAEQLLRDLQLAYDAAEREDLLLTARGPTPPGARVTRSHPSGGTFRLRSGACRAASGPPVRPGGRRRPRPGCGAPCPSCPT